MNEAVTMTADLRNLSQAFCSLKIFYSLFLIEPPSSRYCLGVKVITFCEMHLAHLSSGFKKSPFEFRSHHAEFVIAEQWLWPHFPFLTKPSPRVIYLVKICDLLRPQILQEP